MSKWLHYFLICLCLCNLLSVALYRFKLEKNIKTQFEDIRSNIARYELGIFQDLTNQVVAVLGSVSNQVDTVLASSFTSSASPVVSSHSHLTDKEPFRDHHTSPQILNYQFFTSGGAPWIELEGEYYTLDDEILGYGVISNCSRVAILLTNGDKIFNGFKKTLTNNERIAKND